MWTNYKTPICIVLKYVSKKWLKKFQRKNMGQLLLTGLYVHPVDTWISSSDGVIIVFSMAETYFFETIINKPPPLLP